MWRMALNLMLRNWPPSTGQWTSASYRTDLTSMELLQAGVVNTIEVQALPEEFMEVLFGAGIMVIVDDGDDVAEIDFREGLDYAHAPEPDERSVTHPQTFTFAPAPIPRFATLTMFFSSVSGTTSGGGFRPSVIEVTVDGLTTERLNALNSHDGAEWDTVLQTVLVPPGAASVTVQAFSEDRVGDPTHGAAP